MANELMMPGSSNEIGFFACRLVPLGFIKGTLTFKSKSLILSMDFLILYRIMANQQSFGLRSARWGHVKQSETAGEKFSGRVRATFRSNASRASLNACCFNRKNPGWHPRAMRWLTPLVKAAVQFSLGPRLGEFRSGTPSRCAVLAFIAIY